MFKQQEKFKRNKKNSDILYACVGLNTTLPQYYLIGLKNLDISHQLYRVKVTQFFPKQNARAGFSPGRGSIEDPPLKLLLFVLLLMLLSVLL